MNYSHIEIEMREANRERKKRQTVRLVCRCTFRSSYSAGVFLYFHNIIIFFLFVSYSAVFIYNIFSVIVSRKTVGSHRVLFQFHSIIYDYTNREIPYYRNGKKRSEKNAGTEQGKKANYRSLIKSGAANNTLGAPYVRLEFVSKRILFIPAFALWIRTGTEWDRVWLAQPACGPTTVAKMLRPK